MRSDREIRFAGDGPDRVSLKTPPVRLIDRAGQTRAGLLNGRAIERLIGEAVRREAGKKLLDAMQRLREANVPPLTEEDIAEEVCRARGAQGIQDAVRCVTNTNVVVSGLLWLGHSGRLLEAAANGRITLYTSPVLVAELRSTLSYNRLTKRVERSRRCLTAPA